MRVGRRAWRRLVLFLQGNFRSSVPVSPQASRLCRGAVIADPMKLVMVWQQR